jgi:hypothetical protein
MITHIILELYIWIVKLENLLKVWGYVFRIHQLYI